MLSRTCRKSQTLEMRSTEDTSIVEPANRVISKGPWIMRQSWHNLLFAHWPVAPEAIRHLIPQDLTLDTYGGQAWVGLIAFRLSGIALRGFPAIPPFNAFPEINVRTYVTRDDRPGVYFLSLDANNWAAMALARPWFRLPYTYAAINFREEGDTIHFTSRRQGSRTTQAEFSGSYRPIGEPCVSTPGSLEHFLVERYSFYTQDRRQELCRSDVYHNSWPLQPAEANIVKNTLPLSHGIELPDVQPLLHFASGTQAHIWPLRRLSPEALSIAPGPRLAWYRQKVVESRKVLIVGSSQTPQKKCYNN